MQPNNESGVHVSNKKNCHQNWPTLFYRENIVTEGLVLGSIQLVNFEWSFAHC